MAVKLKPIGEQVIVITGASSGIGLATAYAAASKGAKVVLVARNGEALARAEGTIRASGGAAIHVVADVGARDELQRAADAAVARFGGFDSWVNNAGVGLFGRLEQVSDADAHRLFQTNFWGLVYGSDIAVRHLKARGGALVNMGSIAAEVALPMQGIYAASKNAVKGYTDALRMELEAEGAPVSVTLIKPASINSPFPHHSKNYTDREAKLPPPLYAPEEVAHAVLHAAEHGGRDIYVGGAGKLMSSIGQAAPRLSDWAGETFALPQQFRDEPPRDPEGALHQAGYDGDVWGDEPGYTMRRSYYTRASLQPSVTGAMAALAGLAALAILRGGRRAGS